MRIDFFFPLFLSINEENIRIIGMRDKKKYSIIKADEVESYEENHIRRKRKELQRNELDDFPILRNNKKQMRKRRGEEGEEGEKERRRERENLVLTC
jgi:hypothetical protein